MELRELKLYAKADEAEDDTLIQSLQLAAEEYMINTGVNRDYTKELYKLAIKMLVSHWYYNRDVIGKVDKIAFSLDTIILQLKYTQVEEDTV